MNTEKLSRLPLPSFKNPPLLEVVAGVQFDSSLGFQTLDIADIWHDFGKEEFETYREMPPLDPYVENNTKIIELSDLLPMRRYWFERKKKDKLIQIQRDRFIYNWRRPLENMDDTNCYPRYENVVKKEFFEYYKSFQNTLSNKGIKGFNPSFMELSYINLIDMPEGGLSYINSIFKDINWDRKSHILSAPESMQHRWLFQIPEMPLMLTSDLSTKQRAFDGKTVLQYEMTVRGPVNVNSNEDMLQWFDTARLWIIHSFKDTTTEIMHTKWGIKK